MSLFKIGWSMLTLLSLLYITEQYKFEMNVHEIMTVEPARAGERMRTTADVLRDGDCEVIVKETHETDSGRKVYLTICHNPVIISTSFTEFVENLSRRIRGENEAIRLEARKVLFQLHGEEGQSTLDVVLDIPNDCAVQTKHLTLNGRRVSIVAGTPSALNVLDDLIITAEDRVNLHLDYLLVQESLQFSRRESAIRLFRTYPRSVLNVREAELYGPVQFNGFLPKSTKFYGSWGNINGTTMAEFIYNKGQSRKLVYFMDRLRPYRENVDFH